MRLASARAARDQPDCTAHAQLSRYSRTVQDYEAVTIELGFHAGADGCRQCVAYWGIDIVCYQVWELTKHKKEMYDEDAWLGPKWRIVEKCGRKTYTHNKCVDHYTDTTHCDREPVDDGD